MSEQIIAVILFFRFIMINADLDLLISKTTTKFKYLDGHRQNSMPCWNSPEVYILSHFRQNISI